MPLMSVTAMVLISDVGRSRRDEVAGLVSQWGVFGMIAGPAVAGALLEFGGVDGVFALSAAGLMLGAGVVYALVQGLCGRLADAGWGMQAVAAGSFACGAAAAFIPVTPLPWALGAVMVVLGVASGATFAAIFAGMCGGGRGDIAGDGRHAGEHRPGQRPRLGGALGGVSAGERAGGDVRGG